MKEIERKFLFTSIDYALLNIASKQILVQHGYTKDDIRFSEYIYTDKQSSYRINYKSGIGLSRDEVKCEISKEVFDAVWPLTEGRRISKLRCVLKLKSGLDLEIDLYRRSKVLPLITAEIEFATEEDAEKFLVAELLDYCEIFLDVTGIPGYLNSNLAC